MDDEIRDESVSERSEKSDTLKLALIGNLNVGKSLIFNSLTGIGVEISNFPGTTVGMYTGSLVHKDKHYEIIDFPGVYSLDGVNEEETEVRKFLLEKKADRLIAVLDSTRLERNLYLLLQVAEFQIPTVYRLKDNKTLLSGLQKNKRSSAWFRQFFALRKNSPLKSFFVFLG